MGIVALLFSPFFIAELLAQAIGLVIPGTEDVFRFVFMAPLAGIIELLSALM